MSPQEWAFFKASFTKARQSFSPEHALRIAHEALAEEFYGDPSPGCHCCGRTPKPGCRARSYQAD